MKIGIFGIGSNEAWPSSSFLAKQAVTLENCPGFSYLYFMRIESLLSFKKKLKNAFREVRQIQRGEVKGVELKDFLNEL